jgi:hypothetical protein
VVQGIGQLADSDQEAESEATSHQDGASNVSLPVALLAGDKGDDAKGDDAKKDDPTGESPKGDEDDGEGSGGEKPSESKAQSAAADAPADSRREVDLTGVRQDNTSAAMSQAGNTNETSQDAEQHGAGSGKGPVVQAIGQAAKNDQSADSDATSEQWCPSNLALGALGGLLQANRSWADSQAGNTNETDQDADQGGAESEEDSPAPAARRS